MKQRIFVVEDEASIQELYTYSLENEFECQCFYDGTAFFDALAKSTPSLILLDIMLPGDDGFEILSRLKKNNKTSRIPVIMVSAKGDEVSKVKGLNLGADDYIAKPFGVLELVARIKANMRKGGEATIESIAYKDIFIDCGKHQVTVNGKNVHATLKEYNLLCMLCENAEKVQDRETIFQKVWRENYVGETRTLDIHIKELRRKLAEAGSIASIQTVRGVGYLLT